MWYTNETMFRLWFIDEAEWLLPDHSQSCAGRRPITPQIVVDTGPTHVFATQ